MSEVQASEQAERLFHSCSLCSYQNRELVKNDACFCTAEAWQLTEPGPQGGRCEEVLRRLEAALKRTKDPPALTG